MANSKILVIDDSRVIRKTVKDMLPEGDFEVIEAKDGIEGINLVKEHRPNLIMLDFILPKMSGWEVFQQIQSHPELQKIPLVLMSGRREEVTNKISEPFEYFEFVEKPFDRISLAQAIKDAMAKAKKIRPQATVAPVADSVSYTTSEIEALQERMLEMENATTQSAQEWTNQLSLFRKASSSEIEDLQSQIQDMDSEITTLKKQLAQLVMLLKKKLA